jgi:hypothetical protein
MTAPCVIGTADERQQEERQAVRAETAAMADAFDALQPLGEEARYRAIIWLARALDLPVPYRAATRRNAEDVPF